MSQTLDTRSLNMLIALLVKEETRRFETLPASSDWADFQRRVGFLEGCKFVREACESVEKDLRGGPTTKKN
jgi:hypothetical protein